MASSFVLAAGAPKVGKKAAAKYFAGEAQSSDTEPRRFPSSVESLNSDERYLALGLSSYSSSDSYKWGGDAQEQGVGKWGLDMTYRLSEYNNLLDEAVRVSYTEYMPTDKRASKLSFLYALSLPNAGSQFPLYFGIAAGPGIFFKQLENESPLSLDYQMYLGLRLFNLFDNTGFYIEGGLKNHLHLTSDGQLNGSYVSAGAVFTF